MKKADVRRILPECIAVEIIFLKRSISIWLSGFIWFFLMIVLCLSVISESIIGDAVTTSGWITQALLTLGIILGVIISSREYKSECNELFTSVLYTKRVKIYAKLIILTLISLALLVTGVGSLFLIFLFKHAASEYYIPSIAYIILYWIIPFLTSGAIGLFLGSIIHTKLIYPISILASFLLGPCISMVVSPLGLSSHGVLYEYYVMFNIGQIFANSGISESFGYCLNKELWLAHLLILCGALLLVINVAQTDINKEPMKRWFFVMSSLVLFAMGFIGDNHILKVQFERYRQENLIQYYYEVSDEEYNDFVDVGFDGYSVESYEITVDDGLTMNISVRLELSTADICNNLMFTLYHDFEITELKLDNKECDYDFWADTLLVYYDRLSPGNHEISLKYKGLPPVNLYKADNKWILPGMFAWIPVKYVGIALENPLDQTALFNYPDIPNVSIDVTYLGHNKVFCSMDEIDDNHWVGNSAGVTLASGWFEESTINGLTVVYPYLYEQNAVQAYNLYFALRDFTSVVSEELLSYDITFDNVKRIFVFPSILYTNLSCGMHYFTDHIVICPYSDRNGYLLKYVDGRPELKALLRTPEWQFADSDIITLFEYAYLNSLETRGKFDSKIDFSLENLLYTEDVANLGRGIVNYCNNHTEEDVLRLFREYLTLLNTGHADVESIGELID